MQNQQSFSHNLLYSVAPEYFSSLHLSDDESLEFTHADENSVEDKKWLAKSKIDSFYGLLIKNAIKEQIAQAGIWEVGAGSDGGKFDDTIAGKHSIQFKRCREAASGNEVELDFELIGDARDVLEQFSMDTTVRVSLKTAGCADKYIFDNKTDMRGLRVIDSDLWNSMEIYNYKEFEDIYTQIIKASRFLNPDYPQQ